MHEVCPLPAAHRDCALPTWCLRLGCRGCAAHELSVPCKRPSGMKQQEDRFSKDASQFSDFQLLAQPALRCPRCNLACFCTWVRALSAPCGLRPSCATRQHPVGLARSRCRASSNLAGCCAGQNARSGVTGRTMPAGGQRTLKLHLTVHSTLGCCCPVPLWAWPTPVLLAACKKSNLFIARVQCLLLLPAAAPAAWPLAAW